MLVFFVWVNSSAGDLSNILMGRIKAANLLLNYFRLFVSAFII